MMKSIKAKLIAMYLGLVMIVCGSFILISLQDIELKRAEEQMRLYTEKIKEQVVLTCEETGFQDGLIPVSYTHLYSTIVIEATPSSP